MKRGYGWKKDKGGTTDPRFKASWLSPARYMPLSLMPDDLNLWAWAPPAFDQGMFGTCTCNAVPELLEYNMLVNGDPLVTLSRAWLYWLSGVQQGDTSDDGRQLRDVVAAAAASGVVPEEAWTYDKVLQPIPTDLKATRVYANDCGKVDTTVPAMCTALMVGRPFCIGIPVYPQFESDEAAETGHITLPTWGQTPVGQHAMAVFQIQRSGALAGVLNSWGTGWGNQGRCTIPLEYLTKYGSDFWTIRSNTETHDVSS